MSFSTKFGNQPIAPANPQFLSIALTTNLALVWPLETTGGSPDYVAAAMDIAPSVAALSVAMPPANESASGIVSIMSNTGADSFTLTDTAGNAIQVLAPTQTYVVILTDNSTTDGTWATILLGATTATATAAALAGPGLQANGALLQTLINTTYLSANQAVTSALRANLIIWQGASGTLQMDLIANLTAGFFGAFNNEGSGALTITGSSGQTINGAGSITIQPGNSCFIVCSSSGFNTIGLFPSPVSIVNGGTGANNAPQALTNLGGTAIGTSIFTAPTASAVLALLGITASSINGIIPCTSVTSGGDAIVLTPGITYTNYTNSSYFSWVADASVTAPTTVAVGALAVVNLYNFDGSQAGGADIINGDFYIGIFLQALNSGAGGIMILLSQSANLANGVTPPQGRLTLQAATPVMNANVVASGTVYFVPANGQYVPIWDGANLVPRSIGTGLTLALDSNASHGGYQQSGNLFDLFVFNNNGTITLGTGPAWTSSTPGSCSRGTGGGTTQIAQQNGIWVNAVSISLKIDATSAQVTAAQFTATYVGTMYATGNGQTGMNFNPAPAAGGTSTIIGLYNAYNRVRAKAFCYDTSGATANGNAWVQPGAGDFISYVDGLSTITPETNLQSSVAFNGSYAGGMGVALNTQTTPPINILGAPNITQFANVAAAFLPVIGLNTLTLLVFGSSSLATNFGPFTMSAAIDT